MSWEYAELSKQAKQVGGPEALADSLVKSGKVQMVPWVFGAGTIGIGIGFAVNKAIDFFKDRKRAINQSADTAKQELIQGIERYDAEQKNKSSEFNT